MNTITAGVVVVAVVVAVVVVAMTTEDASALVVFRDVTLDAGVVDWRGEMTWLQSRGGAFWQARSEIEAGGVAACGATPLGLRLDRTVAERGRNAVMESGEAPGDVMQL